MTSHNTALQESSRAHTSTYIYIYIYYIIYSQRHDIQIHNIYKYIYIHIYTFTSYTCRSIYYIHSQTGAINYNTRFRKTFRKDRGAEIYLVNRILQMDYLQPCSACALVIIIIIIIIIIYRVHIIMYSRFNPEGWRSVHGRALYIVEHIVLLISRPFSYIRVQ